MTSVSILSVVLSVAGTIWSFVKGSEWFKQRVNEQQTKAIDLVESIVMKVYNTFTLAEKAASDDGKLPIEARKEALQIAVSECMKAAKEQGLSNLPIFKNEDLLVNQIEWAIRGFKNA